MNLITNQNRNYVCIKVYDDLLLILKTLKNN